jgi:RimJ/RimL family protein N-acetyltransferase
MFRWSGWFDVDVAYLAIETAGLLIGEVDVRRIGPVSANAFEVGMELYDPARRGTGLGGEAFELLLGYLFDQGAASRVEASTAPDNMPMRRILEKIGFAPTTSSPARVRYVCTAQAWQERIGS